MIKVKVTEAIFRRKNNVHHSSAFIYESILILFHTNNKYNNIPAGIWCENDVGSTSMRRHHVASMLIRRHFGTKCPLGILIKFEFERSRTKVNATVAVLRKENNAIALVPSLKD